MKVGLYARKTMINNLRLSLCLALMLGIMELHAMDDDAMNIDNSDITQQQSESINQRYGDFERTTNQFVAINNTPIQGTKIVMLDTTKALESAVKATFLGPDARELHDLNRDDFEILNHHIECSVSLAALKNIQSGVARLPAHVHIRTATQQEFDSLVNTHMQAESDDDFDEEFDALHIDDDQRNNDDSDATVSSKASSMTIIDDTDADGE